MPDRDRFKQIKLIVFDVDGIFTDGRTWQDAKGSSRRYFGVRDAMGVRALLKSGLEIAIVTDASAQEIREHVALMGVRDFYEKCGDKSSALAELMKRHAVATEEVALITEKTQDLNWVRSVPDLGLCITVPTASPELQQAASMVTGRSGGDGAVLEICNLFLAAFKEVAPRKAVS